MRENSRNILFDPSQTIDDTYILDLNATNFIEFDTVVMLQALKVVTRSILYVDLLKKIIFGDHSLSNILTIIN